MNDGTCESVDYIITAAGVITATCETDPSNAAAIIRTSIGNPCQFACVVARYPRIDPPPDVPFAVASARILTSEFAGTIK